MSQTQSMSGYQPSLRSDARPTASISTVILGLSLSVFFVISYLICIAGYLLFPAWPVQHAVLSIFLPGFELLSWRSFCLGMGESFVWGWYVALVFAPLYNFFGRRVAR